MARKGGPRSVLLALRPGAGAPQWNAPSSTTVPLTYAQQQCNIPSCLLKTFFQNHDNASPGRCHVSVGEGYIGASRAKAQRHESHAAFPLHQSFRCFSEVSDPASGSEAVECVVVGAGVVGLAIARQLAQAGKEVLVLESEPAFGMGTSSRNSEVIHAGFYYDPGSLKARFCVEGRRALYEYCKERGIEQKNLGKLVVATSEEQLPKLQALQARGIANGVEGLRLINTADAKSMEPNVECVGALHSQTTGILDSHGFMAALQAEAEQSGAMFAFNTPVLGIEPAPDGTFHVSAGEWPAAEQGTSLHRPRPSPSVTIKSKIVVNSAGLTAVPLAHHTAGLPRHAIPKRFLAKGNYFSLANVKPPQPFSRLIYPLPEDGGIGVHVTLDLAGGVKFGPDVQWLPVAPDNGLHTQFDYSVDLSRADRFYGEIRKYYPSLPDGSLQADYSGMRPKVSGPGQPAGDFMIRHEVSHGLKGLVNLFGIESPGLTCALAIGKYVHSLLKEADL